MVATVNTNAGALQALASLRETNKALDITTKRIQTGYRVADAFDDASTFAVAQGIRGNLKQYSAVQNGLSSGEGLGQVAGTALKGISDLIGDIKQKISQLSNGSNTTAQNATYGADLDKMLNQALTFLNQATYNGKNLFTGGSSAVNYLSDIAGGTLSLSAQQGTSTAYTTFASVARSFTGAMYANAGSSSAITSVNTAIASFEGTVNATMGSVAAETRSFTLQKGFISDLLDATKKGLGALVDADVSEESANLQALQVLRLLVGD